ncbi:mechanosensitive ion channel family protein [Shewanella pealeana]|uniref:Small-conductance mechanosensitive channel n=1 Tax=Shewanella pealeana (strain ATCC 700345 / ANG-SQ1) TaxID=398579 RepID=A8H8Z3_SHEPA|nr:mechanosensitive ion channel family protein [Shewanella pealeana]ABV89030.1 MscS Mechanosensitive ion channel [Shewanella pealeana ATCC 700345]
MHKMLPQILMLILSLCSFTAAAENTELTNNLNKIQSLIDNDVKALPSTKGEIKSFLEYRIGRNAALLQDTLKEQVEKTDPDFAFLKPYIVKQLAFTNEVEAYFEKQKASLMSQVGSGSDNKVMVGLMQIQREQDKLFTAEKSLLNWAQKAGIDTDAQTKTFIATLITRADDLNSFVYYNQERLTQAVADVQVAGTDVSAEQKSLVVDLKERLEQSSTSLSTTIELLDSLDQDTALYKQTLFSISGDITQDVLNLDVASSLLSEWMTIAKNQAMENGASILFKLIIFCLILFLSSLVGKVVKSVVQKTVSNSKLKFSMLLQDFFISLSGKAVFALGLLIALSQLGFELAPLLAGFGIAGVIIGFALQDTLSNFASGMMILIYRPFDVGDLINAGGVTGRVSHMSLVSTTIKTLDNQRLIVPNNKIWGDTINNITVEHQRRVDMTFGIGYGDNIEHAEKVLHDIVMAHPLVLKDPEPMIKLHTLGESSVDFIVRPWAKPEDYWDVYWDITRTVKMRFDAEGISIPFPQRDVHIYQTAIEK